MLFVGGAFLYAGLIFASTLQASIVTSVLNTTAASGSTNRITLDIDAPSPFSDKSVTARVQGTVNTRLNLMMNPFTGDLLSFNGMELTGGNCIFIDDSDGDRKMSVSWNIIFVAGLDVDIENLACSFDTPSPFGSVSPTSNDNVFNFPTEEHEVIINEGTLVADGTGLASSVNYNMNFATEPMNATTEGTGVITIGDPSISGTKATYSLGLELPIAVNEAMPVEGLGEATISGEATFKATGSFSYYLTTVALPGDLNGDGFVGSADLDIVRANWGGTVTPGYLAGGDASGDGQIGSSDLDIVRGNWGAGTPPAAAAVPEPSVFTGLAILLLGAFGIRRK